MGVQLSYPQVVFACGFSLFVSFLPIPTLAGFGPIQGAWAFALGLLNVPGESAIASGFSLHIMSLIYSGVLGMSGMLRLLLKGQSTSAQKQK